MKLKNFLLASVSYPAILVRMPPLKSRDLHRILLVSATALGIELDVKPAPQNKAQQRRRA